MLTPRELWSEIRRRVVTGEISLRQACSEYGLNFRTVRKMVRHSEPPPFCAPPPRAKPVLGPFLAIVQQSLPMSQATGEIGVQYDAARFNWIGSPILLDDVLGLRMEPSEARPLLNQFTSIAEGSLGILVHQATKRLSFFHRSFQEYLAACHLTDDDFPAKLAELVRSDPNRWREVVLLAGAKAARGSSQNAWTLSEALCLAPPPDGPAPEATSVGVAGAKRRGDRQAKWPGGHGLAVPAPL